MANELLRSRHAFGALEQVLEAISNNKVDAYDILFLKDKNGKPYIGWVEKDGTPIIIREEEKVLPVDVLPEVGESGKIYIYNEEGYFWDGEKFINLCKSIDLTALEDELAKIKATVEHLESEIGAIKHSYEKIKYEFSDVPVGTLVTYRENEIRVMCPANSEWVKQSVGNGGDASCYYGTFKTYVPNDEVVGYIEHLGDKVDSEILTSFSVDEYGRKYQPTWLALAKYDEATDTWSYYGEKSSTEKYIGWDYQIDWYNADGVMIASDSVRINLSNEECHSSIEPYYAQVAVESAKAYTDEQIALVLDSMSIVEF